MVQILLMPAKPTMMYTMCHLSVNFIFFVSFFASLHEKLDLLTFTHEQI